MEETIYYEDSRGVQIKGAELRLGNAATEDGSTLSIGVADIDSAMVHDRGGWDHWKRSVRFLAGGIIVWILPQSGWIGFFIGLAMLAWGGIIAFHPSQRDHTLFLLPKVTGHPSWRFAPMKFHRGPGGRQYIESIKDAIATAKAQVRPVPAP